MIDPPAAEWILYLAVHFPCLDVLHEVLLDVVLEVLALKGLGHAGAHLVVLDDGREDSRHVREDTCKTKLVGT